AIALRTVELWLRRRDDPEIVFGVLQIGFGQNRVARRLGIASQLHVFLGNMSRRTAHLYVRTIRFIGPAQGVRPLAVAIAAAHTLLLTLPHGCFSFSATRRANHPRAAKTAATIATAGFARILEIHRPDCVCATALPRQSATLASGNRNKHFCRL